MADEKQVVWVCENSDGFVLDFERDKYTMDAIANSTPGRRVVRYVPEDRIRALESELADSREGCTCAIDR